MLPVEYLRKTEQSSVTNATALDGRSSSMWPTKNYTAIEAMPLSNRD